MIVGPCRVITGGSDPRVIEDGAVRVVGAHIAQVGLAGVLAASHPGDTCWPARGRVLMPGLVNAHAHLARHLARGLPEAEAGGWERYERALSPEDVYAAALAALVEGLRHGITTTCDLHRSGSCLELSLSEVASAADRLGVRLATAYAASDLDEPRARDAARRESLGLCAELRRRGHGRLRGMVGVTATSVSGLEAVLAECTAGAGAEHPLHVELAFAAAATGRWGGPDAGAGMALWAHADRAPAPLAFAARRRGDALMTSGTSAGGPLPAEAMAWGSDAGALAPPVLDAERAADPRAAATHYRRLFVNGPAWAERTFGAGLGVLEPGAPADLVLVDYSPPTPLDAGTLAAHLATGLGRALVSGVMVAGRIVLDHGTLVTVDEAEVAGRARECAARVWRALAGRRGAALSPVSAA